MATRYVKPNVIPPGFHVIEMNRTVYVIPERYTELSPIGQGAYGQVVAANDTTLGMRVAIKKLSRPFQTNIHAKRTYREVKMLKMMNHENVIGLLNLFTSTPNFENFEDVYFVSDLGGADLNTRIKRFGPIISEAVKLLVYQLLRGLKYIHSAGIIHRDLKPSNIAVNEDCELKILDFGLARQTDDEMTGYVATRWYRGPEIMLNWMHYGQTADIWSVGCIMAEMLSGKPLFPGSDHIDQLTKIMDIVGTPSKELLNKINSEDARRYVESLSSRPRRNFSSIFPTASPSAIDLLEKMLDLDPDKRLDATTALQHPYLEQYHDPDDEPVADFTYDSSVDNDPTEEITTWKARVYEEVSTFTPRAQQL